VDIFVDEFNIEWIPKYQPLVQSQTQIILVKHNNNKKKSKKMKSLDFIVDSPKNMNNLIYRTRLEWNPPLSSPSCLDQILLHPRVKFLIEQLPGNEMIPGEIYQFINCHDKSSQNESLWPNPSGSARSEPFTSRRPHDMFNWLRSKYRQPPKNYGIGLGM
jgi:hypothetical protein